jgi:hypothetical protein
MSSSPPTPPSELPDDLVDTLDERPPKLLRHVARYAAELAECREREARIANETDESDYGDDGDDSDTDERPDDADGETRPDGRPDDVPSKATITTKEINDNRYYYWQWREGDRVTSRYEGPVDSDE